MVAIFCRVTAELSPDFLVNFPRQFDFTSMLTKICEDVGVDISFQNETFLLHGDWISIGRTRNMLVSTLAVYGNACSVYREHADTVPIGSRPFSALVEAAEAISRGVELQEQVQSEMTQMNQPTDSTPSANLSSDCSKCEDHDYDNVTSYQQNFMDDQEYTSECSTHESQDGGDYQNNLSDTCSEVIQQQHQASVDVSNPSKQELELFAGICVRNRSFDTVVPEEFKLKDTIKKKVEEVVAESHFAAGHDSVSNIFSCTTCEFVGKSKPDLLNHKACFHKNQVAKCDICDKIFANITYMKRHRIRHKDVIYTCEECGNKYKDFKTLKEHQKTHDKDYVKPEYKCESCPKSFCSVYKRECHFKSEHLGIKKTFLCQTCGKSFTTNKTLQQHVNGHKGIRPYKCSQCGKCFTYESALNDHLFIHVDSKTFLCEYPDCKKAFRQRSALKMHENIHKNPNQFECSQCGRGFTQKQALQRHIRSHKGLKPFRCKYCGRSFGDTSIIRRHMKLVHKLNKDLDKWREDIIEETIEDIENDKEKSVLDSPQAALEHVEEVTVLQTVQTTKESTFKPNTDIMRSSLKENGVQIVNSDTEVNTSNIQNVFVTFNLPSQNLVLANTASSEFDQNSTQLIQYHFKPTEASDSESNCTEKPETEVMNSKQETGQDLLQPEADSSFIEREQIQLLTENLDGTFNTTVDFSKLKRNLELLTKSSASVDMNMSSDQQNDILKPDGTEAEIPLNSSPENTARFGELETLSDSLGLSVSQFQSCYYNLGNQFLSGNQTQLNSNLNDTLTERNIPEN